MHLQQRPQRPYLPSPSVPEANNAEGHGRPSKAPPKAIFLGGSPGGNAIGLHGMVWFTYIWHIFIANPPWINSYEKIWVVCWESIGCLFLGVSLNGGTYPHFTPQCLIIFSRKTHGCWVPHHFRKPPCMGQPIFTFFIWHKLMVCCR